MIILASMETEFSSHGGLGAVMKLLPREIGENECAIIAPLFPKVTVLAELHAKKAIQKLTTRLTFHILIRGVAFPVTVIEAVNTRGLSIFFIGSDSFFQAPANPYVNPANPTGALDPYRNPNNTDRLAEDALFFCIAAPLALAELAKAGHLASPDITVHLQDWETAAMALAFKRTRTFPALRSVRCLLTVHNPYDKPLHRLNSALTCDFASHLGLRMHRSLLEQVIPLMDGPVSTVSAGFAHELRNEVLYTQIFCPHLQKAFREQGLVGIDNGIFGAHTFPFSARAYTSAQAGDFSQLAKEKRTARKPLQAAMNGYLEQAAGRPDAAWGGPLKTNDPDTPVFLLLGRDDARQKGFDVMIEAIRQIPPGAARFLFTVLPGDEGLSGLAFMRRLAEERPHDVCILPARIPAEVFDAIRKGCSFLVMGSLYEPFGAANEGYLSGMPVVARATGGLVQQVTPAPECMENENLLSLYGRQIVRRYHQPDAGPTGLLYREQVAFADEVEGWRELMDCAYWEQNPKGDRIESRASILLFRDMVRSATEALQLAIALYQDPDRYAAMIYHGWNLLDQFQWSRAVASYRQHLYEASTPSPEGTRP